MQVSGYSTTSAPPAVKPVSSPINLSGRLGTPITVAPVEEIVAVSELDTVLKVMTAPARLGAVIASLTTATKEKVGNPYSKQVETLEREQYTDKQQRELRFHQTLHRRWFPRRKGTTRHLTGVLHHKVEDHDVEQLGHDRPTEDCIHTTTSGTSSLSGHDDGGYLTQNFCSTR